MACGHRCPSPEPSTLLPPLLEQDLEEGGYRRIKDEEALLREARKRLQALRTELARSTEQEARLVRALGGEDAAAAAVAAAAAGAQQGCREERCCSASACFDGA